MTINELMADVEVEGSLSNEEAESLNNNEQGTETPAESPADNKPTEEAPSQEGVQAQVEPVETPAEPVANTPDENNDLPLNKNPRFKEVIEEKNYFKEQYEKTLGLVQQLQESVRPIADQVRLQHEANKPVETVQIPKFFTDVYGEDPEAYKEFLNVQRSEAQKVLDEARSRDQQESEARQRQKAEEEQYIGEQFKAIEEKFGTRLEPGTHERNEFTKFYLENPIGGFDANGVPRYDLVKGYELFNRMKTAEQSAPSASVAQKKAIASQTIDRTASAPVKTGLTREQKAKMSYREIAEYALKEKGLFN